MAKMISSNEALILGTLHSGKKSGAQIIDIARTIDGLWTCTRSQVYRDLKSLEGRGAIKASNTDVPPPSREAYVITDVGREMYTLWLANVVMTDHIRSMWALRVMLAEHDGSDKRRVCADAARAYGVLTERAIDPESSPHYSDVAAWVMSEYFSAMKNAFIAEGHR